MPWQLRQGKALAMVAANFKNPVAISGKLEFLPPLGMYLGGFF